MNRLRSSLSLHALIVLTIIAQAFGVAWHRASHEALVHHPASVLAAVQASLAATGASDSPDAAAIAGAEPVLTGLATADTHAATDDVDPNVSGTELCLVCAGLTAAGISNYAHRAEPVPEQGCLGNALVLADRHGLVHGASHLARGPPSGDGCRSPIRLHA